jgi:hypothetical protein
MPDSSTEIKNDKSGSPGEGEAKVPVAAIGAERAKTRAAHEDNEKLRQENEKLKNGQIDAGELSKVVADMVLDVRKQLESEFAPLKAENAKYRMAVEMGLSGPQADKVIEIRGKLPGLTEAQALLLAREENRELFPQQAAPQAWNKAIHGGIPVTGLSQVRNEPQATDYTAKMIEAERAGKKGEAHEFARQAFFQRLHASFPTLTRPPR